MARLLKKRVIKAHVILTPLSFEIETHVGVSENRGTLFRGPYNKDPSIYDTILGSPIFGTPPI